MLNSLRIKYVHSSFNFLHSRIYNTFLLLRKGKGSMVERLLSLHPRLPPPYPHKPPNPNPKDQKLLGWLNCSITLIHFYKNNWFLIICPECLISCDPKKKQLLNYDMDNHLSLWIWIFSFLTIHRIVSIFGM